MAPAKIDRIQLNKHLNAGKSQAEIARMFEVSEAAISKAVRRFNLAVAQTIVEKQTPELVSKRETAMDRLMSLIERCDDELKWIEKTVPLSNDEGYRAWQDQKIKHVAEIRKLITSMADIRVRIYHVEAVEKALKVMYEEIGNESMECQKRIRDRLRKSSIHFQLDD